MQQQKEVAGTKELTISSAGITAGDIYISTCGNVAMDMISQHKSSISKSIPIFPIVQ